MDSEFQRISEDIVVQEKTVKEWAAIESSDMFQSPKYTGGFDADEGEFCFSVYLPSGEYWFQLPIEDVYRVANGERLSVEIRPAD